MKPLILAFSGSPKHGNTDTILEQAVKGAEQAGARVETIYLCDLKFSGCCGWTNCFYEGFCVVDDNMQDLYKKLFESKAWILASPNYFNNVSGLMKNFIDRTNPYALKKQFEGKKALILTCGGWSLDSVQWAENYLREFCRIHRVNVMGSYKVKADQKWEAEEQKQALLACFKLGEQLGKTLESKT